MGRGVSTGQEAKPGSRDDSRAGGGAGCRAAYPRPVSVETAWPPQDSCEALFPASCAWAGGHAQNPFQPRAGSLLFLAVSTSPGLSLFCGQTQASSSKKLS